MRTANSEKLLAALLAAALAGCASASGAKTHASDNGVRTEDTDTIPFEEFTAIDNDQCAVIIKEVDPDSFWGCELKAVLENRSDGKTYMFVVDGASINGVMCPCLFAGEVTAVKKSSEAIDLSVNHLLKNGIKQFTDIELTFRIYDSNDRSADPAVKETVHIYPYGSENAVKFVREAQPADQVLIDNDDVTVIAVGYDPEKSPGYAVNLYLVNKTGKKLMYSIEEASLNNFMADPFFGAVVSPQRSAFTHILWDAATLEENDIADVEEIAFRLRIRDADDVFSVIADENCTLRP